LFAVEQAARTHRPEHRSSRLGPLTRPSLST
jgi:hypothetical protein